VLACAPVGKRSAPAVKATAPVKSRGRGA
jgi:hypothetical protein